MQLVLLHIVYSQAQGCVCTVFQLGGEEPWLVSKYDIIRKTGSTQLITTLSEEDLAMALGNMHKLVKIGRVFPKI